MFEKYVIKVILGFFLTTVFCFAMELPSTKLVDVKWLADNKSNSNLLIIDVRSNKNLYDKAHIPNAIHWSESEMREVRYETVPGFVTSPLSFTRLINKSGIDKDTNIIFYSDGMTDDSFAIAGLAVFITEYYGIKKTAILNGGFAKWKIAGCSVDNERVVRKRTNWKIDSMRIDNVATLYDIDKYITLKTTQLVDARGNAQAFGEKKHPKAKKSGHLPGAKHVYVGNFTKNTNGAFVIDSVKAKKMLIKEKINLNKLMVWYCNTGWNASGAWFVSKYVLGLKKVKVYDGSMVEYTAVGKRKLIKGSFN